MKKVGVSIKAPKFLGRFAALPKDPAKTQMMALKRSIQPKGPGKMGQPRKLKGSV